VLGLDPSTALDDLTDEARQALLQLSHIEDEHRRERTKSQAGDLVYKSESREPFYIGPGSAADPGPVRQPLYIGLPSAQQMVEKARGWQPEAYSVRDVTRASCGLFTPLSREGALMVEAETTEKAWLAGIGIHEILHSRRPHQPWPML
jgi:hypothetical protein